ncbi:MAG: pyridoxamine 5'-phosphate oxidase [Myxococcota bacterium]|nr:pyridoxamine 5'-phosphate oxidase [Myxococcota bacterium]
MRGAAYPDAWLSEAAPADPLPTLRDWIAAARTHDEILTPDAVTLATSAADGRPEARIVLCRSLDPERGFAGFYTNRDSRKGRALQENARAALVFFWDGMGRQARLEGPVTLAPDDDSDAYFATRPLDSQLACWATAQSEAIASRAELLARLATVQARYAATDAIPRPPHWGGYRVWAERVELWVTRPARLHDRVEYSRKLTSAGDGFRGGPWQQRRLQP